MAVYCVQAEVAEIGSFHTARVIFPLFEGRWNMSAPPPTSDIHLFGECNRVIDFDTEVSDCALDLGVA